MCPKKQSCRKFFYGGGGLSKNAGHHGCPTKKKFKVTLDKTP